MASQNVGSTCVNTAVSVGGTAVVLVDGSSNRESLTVHNAHATQSLSIGGTAAVTLADGLRIVAGGTFTFSDYVGPLWGIASGAATDVRVMEVL